MCPLQGTASLTFTFSIKKNCWLTSYTCHERRTLLLNCCVAWLEPVPDNPTKAYCRCCDVKLIARFSILRQHARSLNHAEKERHTTSQQPADGLRCSSDSEYIAVTASCDAGNTLTASGSHHKGSPVVNEVWMKTGRWLGSVLCVPYSALKLMVGWQKGHPAP